MTDLTILKTGAVTVAAQAILLQPECVRLRRMSLGTIEWEGRMTRYLAGDLKLTEDDRKNALRFVDELRRLCSIGDENQAREERYRVIAKMLLAKPVANASALKGAAVGEVYQEALDDIPPWAVAAFARQWHRGECERQWRGDECVDHNYTWAPDTSVWRKGALELIKPYQRALEHLEALLRAKPFDQAFIEVRPNVADNKPLPPARPPKPPPPADSDHAKRALWDLSWRKMRREPAAPSVFELNPATWDA